ncbi:hypothetical protein DFJ58DRAFT_824142 [Suillus subalutaceus]|uniref:uncharacterized protein n=1 Tax=Suillus subalutaceus TaxID=48586 RepID=UPI001B867485|nr:uncharacterized protein DFJ58DRAFT_824142 [Suillus subalutaceus]KAG1831168.1 hypothetical protein DFJ58DRAFT_824142 [Suillus subalutaceus]
MVTKLDREERGVGMQNFKYAPSWDEFANVLRIHSPQALQFLSKHLPVRTERSFREKESRRPRFPMIISTLVQTSLSRDDTKLYAAWRVFWDANKQAHYLVGGVGEPYLVADPDALREIIEEVKLTLATKM